MKIEGFGHIKATEQVQIIGQSAVKLTDGEILIARIESILGDRVTLKNSQGAFFMALMQGDLGLAQGDIVEVSASETGNGYVLHLLDIDKEAANTAPRQTEMPGTLPGAMAMMKANPGLDPKSAAFLIENSIPISAQNIAALSNVVRTGNGLAELLAGILMGLSQEDPMPRQQAVQNAQPGIQGESPIIENGTAVKGSENAEAGANINASGAEASSTAEAAAAQAGASAGQSGSTAGTLAADEAGNTAQQSPAAQSAAVTPGAEIPQAYTAQAGSNAGAQSVFEQSPDIDGQNYSAWQPSADKNASGKGVAVLSGDNIAADEQILQAGSALYNKEQISEKIMEFFIEPDAVTGAQLKKTVTEAEDNLRELKMMLDSSDTNNKKVYIEKAEQAIRQLDLTSAAKRFDYIQLPLLLKNGRQSTAELYVYRRPRKKEQGEEGLTVLVALDTQYIGRIETLIKTAGSAISLEFRLERKEIQQEITKRAKALAKSLDLAGYRLKSVRITKLENRTTVINAAGPPEDAAVKSGNVDVKI